MTSTGPVWSRWSWDWSGPVPRSRSPLRGRTGGTTAGTRPRTERPRVKERPAPRTANTPERRRSRRARRPRCRSTRAVCTHRRLACTLHASRLGQMRVEVPHAARAFSCTCRLFAGFWPAQTWRRFLCATLRPARFSVAPQTATGLDSPRACRAPASDPHAPARRVGVRPGPSTFAQDALSRAAWRLGRPQASTP